MLHDTVHKQLKEFFPCLSTSARTSFDSIVKPGVMYSIRLISDQKSIKSSLQHKTDCNRIINLSSIVPLSGNYRGHMHPG